MADDLLDMDYVIDGQYMSQYRLFKDGIVRGNRGLIEPINYMLNIAFASRHYNDKRYYNYMFIGGLGVLCHLMRVIGSDGILNWRGTKDVDLILPSESSYAILKDGLKCPNLRFRSTPNIPNKYTAKFRHTQIDVVTTKNSSDVSVSGVLIADEEWERMQHVNLFGVEVNILNIVSLLTMKLAVETQNKLLRDKDEHDIGNLVTMIARQEKISPAELIRTWDNPKQTSRLHDVCQKLIHLDRKVCKNLFFKPSSIYLKDLAYRASLKC